jgi:prepilin-type N-terminal cleavage/methylation domain-containing protein
MKNKNIKGFTLIELLVVIAIIAILSVTVILTLNPAELLRQARDSTRVSDLGTLRTALATYLADETTPVLATDYADCYVGGVSPGANCGFAGTYTVATSSDRSVDGTGWLPVDFTDISSGAPIGTLPVDPVNTGTNTYRYAASTTLVFEINADLESARQTDTDGAEETDGGDDLDLYEIGNAPNLEL